MNPNKAREHFSAYYEGSLDPGLKQSFERKLATDAAIQAEYQAFARAVDQLNELKNLPIETPFDLHDRITARLDHHLWERKQKRAFSLVGWWKAVAVGGLATVAILATIFSLKGGGGQYTAGALTSPVREEVRLLMKGDRLQLSYRASGRATIKIHEGVGGKVLQTIQLDRQAVESPISNAGEKPTLVSITCSADSRRMVVALPGTTPSREVEGDGTVSDLALAAAGYYQVPVRIETEALDAKVRWKLVGETVSEAVSSDLDQSGLALEKRDGMLVILKH